MSRDSKTFFAVLILSACLFSPKIARAVPYFAVMEGAKCSACHVSPTGAGMRRENGVRYFRRLPFEATQSLSNQDYKGKLNDFFALGGDLRVRHLATVQAPGPGNTFQIPQGSLYVRVDPFRHFSLYSDTDLANVSAREAYGLIHELWQGLWIKFGRFNLPYGLRIPDDSSFIRSDLGFGFGAQDIGLEAGLEPGPISIALAVTNGTPGAGTDDNQNKAITSNAVWLMTDFFRLGGSFQWNDRLTSRSVTGGGYAGVHFWRIALLGEVDLQNLRDKSTGTERTVVAGLGEVDWRMVPGLVFKGTYDVVDDKLAGSGLHHRIGTGLEIYPIPHLEISLLYRTRIGPGLLGADQTFVLLHGFF